MNWDDLRFLLALSRERTMSAAGIKLKVKHTTVARRIKALEESLGTRLFDQLSDGYALTQAGENLHHHAIVMEEQAQAVDRSIIGLDAELHGELNLTSSQDVFNLLVIPHLGLFRRAYPGIKLNLFSSAALADMAARQADIALRMTAKPPDYLIGQKVLPLSHGVYASKKYLKRQSSNSLYVNKGGSRKSGSQKEEQIILWSGEHTKPDWVKNNFPHSKVAIQTSDIATMLACTINHHGIARMPCYIGDSAKELLRIDADLKPSNWGVWVLSHVDLRATARVRVCREFLVNTIEQQKDLIGGLSSRYFVG